MYPASANTLLSELATVSAVSAAFTLVMIPKERYLFVSTTACFIKQSAGATAATAASTSMLWPANYPLFIDGSLGARLTVIRDTTDGKASLTPSTL